VLYGHVFRNAMLIVIAGFPGLFLGPFRRRLLIENIFSLDGLGRMGFRRRSARLSGDLWHALHLRPDRAGGRHHVGPDVCLVDPRIDFEKRAGMKLSPPLNQRRWRNFKANRRALWSLGIFLVLFGLSLFAELLANDRPILVKYRARLPALPAFYPETAFGGDFNTEAELYRPRCNA
jgi:hypothetical protein